VTALPSKHCSGQHKATEEEGDRRTHGGGSSIMKCGQRVSGTAGGRWRRQRRTELDGDELSVGVTSHKSSKSSQVLRRVQWLKMLFPQLQFIDQDVPALRVGHGSMLQDAIQPNQERY